MCGPALKNSIVGIVGFGRIGQEIAKLIKPFNVASILYSGRTEKEEAEGLQAKFVPLDILLKSSDFVIVTCSLTPDTQNLFNEHKFSLMKPTAIFINTSRGGNFFILFCLFPLFWKSVLLFCQHLNNKNSFLFFFFKN